jgi:uncharacterized protein YdeI (YjbR/CyaY-like superfamily)
MTGTMPPKADWLPSRPSLGPLLQGMTKTERRPLAFQDARELGEWLAKHHQSSSELWVQIFKAGSGTPSVTWTDCVVEAIRFGWIDGQKLPLDEKSYLQRLTPRKPKSNWSAKNREHAIRLIAEGRMAPAGLAHVEAAKADGRWESAYTGSATMIMPQDFLEALEAMPAAKAFFQTLDRKNLYPIYYRLHTAKRPETRAKRLGQILAQLDRGERFHSH